MVRPNRLFSILELGRDILRECCGTAERREQAGTRLFEAEFQDVSINSTQAEFQDVSINSAEMLTALTLPQLPMTALTPCDCLNRLWLP